MTAIRNSIRVMLDDITNMLKSGKLKLLSITENLMLAPPYNNNIIREANCYIKESQFEFLASV